jgi:hypothetical protein
MNEVGVFFSVTAFFFFFTVKRKFLSEYTSCNIHPLQRRGLHAKHYILPTTRTWLHSDKSNWDLN